MLSYRKSSLKLPSGLRLLLLITALQLGAACRTPDSRQDGDGFATNLASISIRELPDAEAQYDRIRLQAFRSDQPDKSILDTSTPRGQGTITAKLQPGNYALQLEYMQGESLRYTSLGCDNPPQFALTAGNNPLTIYLCDPSGRRTYQEEARCAPEQPALGRRQLRLLTNNEYQSTITDLTGFNDPVSRDLPKEIKSHGLDNLADTRTITESHADAYLRVATRVSQRMRGERSRFISCNNNEAEQSCITRFINDFGKRVFRGPVSAEETKGLVQVFNAGKADTGRFDDAFEFVVQAMLISPRFLYRPELGQLSGDSYALDQWEIAQALSYLYWGSMPDKRLFELAEAGQLSKLEIIRSEAERLLSDARARQMTGRFLSSWLGSDAVLAVNKDNLLHPQFDSNLRIALLNETRDFFNTIVFDEQGKFADLFLSQESIGGPAIASLYGGRSDNGRILFDTRQRRGLLGHASVLASYADADQTAPIKRGKFVLEQLLCQDLPPPPPSLMIKPPPRNPNATTRERFAAHSNNPNCATCHTRIDGVGFGLEDMDEIGRFRTQQNGKPVDASGVLIGLDGQDQPFSGTAELSALIAQSRTAERCFVKQIYRRSSGYLETQADTCAIDRLHQRLSQPDATIRDLLLSLPEQDAFRLKK